MQLKLREVAQILRLSEDTVERWARSGELPTKRVQGRYSFNRLDVLESALLREIALDLEMLERHWNLAGQFQLVAALEAGQVTRLNRAEDISILDQIVRQLPLSKESDRQTLLEMFRSRPAAGFLTTDGQIKVPHPRYPVILDIQRPSISVFHTDAPVLPDVAKTSGPEAVFVILAPSARLHYALLAQLTVALSSRPFRRCIEETAGHEQFHAAAQRLAFVGKQTMSANSADDWSRNVVRYQQGAVLDATIAD